MSATADSSCGELRETKHLWLFLLGGSLQKRSEMESLASRTSSAGCSFARSE